MPFDHGEVHWNELGTRDVASAKAYYAQTCGWTWDEMPMPDGLYHVARIGERMVGGMWDITSVPGMEETPSHWLMYIALNDVDGACKATSEAGGQVLREPFEVPGVGRIAIVKDPAGATVGLMTPSS